MKLTDDMKNMIAEELAYMATTDDNNFPNVGPKRSMRVLDDNKLIYCENTGGQHFANIQANGRVSVCFIKRYDNLGYRFSGNATAYQDEEHMELAEKIVGDRPKKAAVIIELEKAYTMASGPMAGKEIVE